MDPPHKRTSTRRAKELERDLRDVLERVARAAPAKQSADRHADSDAPRHDSDTADDDDACAATSDGCRRSTSAWIAFSVVCTLAFIVLLRWTAHSHATWCKDKPTSKYRTARDMCSDVHPHRSLYFTHWAAVIVLVWIPISIALRRRGSGDCDVVRVGNFAVAVIACLVLVVRLLVLGLPGDAPLATNVMDLLVHLVLPIAGIALYMSSCTPAPNGKNTTHGAVVIGVVVLVWLLVNMLYWHNGRPWVYGDMVAPSTKVGLSSLVIVSAVTVGLATALVALKRRLRMQRRSTCIVWY